MKQVRWELAGPSCCASCWTNPLHFTLPGCLPHTVMTRAALPHPTLHSVLWKSRVIEWQSHSALHLSKGFYSKDPFIFWPSPLCPSFSLASPRPKRAHEGATEPFQKYILRSPSLSSASAVGAWGSIWLGTASISRLPENNPPPPQTQCCARAVLFTALSIKAQILLMLHKQVQITTTSTNAVLKG